MKYTLAVAALLGHSYAIKLAKRSMVDEPWLPETLPSCPADETRTVMDDGKTHVTKYPYVGASCKA